LVLVRHEGGKNHGWRGKSRLQHVMAVVFTELQEKYVLLWEKKQA
jgi:hypothetical protein